jgi:hypothetical protein
MSVTISSRVRGCIDTKTLVSRTLQFPASSQDVQALAKACEPAPFGRNHEDVLDDNYRRAGKMDRSRFSISLGASSGTSLDKTAGELLDATPSGDSENIDVDLYKLNVYGASHPDLLEILLFTPK